MGNFCGGLNAYCMHIRPLFLRTSGSSGVLKALLLERNGQLSCNPKPKKKLGPALQHVIGPTQTVSVPAPWTGANVLWHLEVVEYLQQTGQPGCIVFSKAYGRLSRSWVQKCMRFTQRSS